MDDATRGSGNKDTARPRILRQLRKIDFISLAFTVAGLLVALFPEIAFGWRVLLVVVVVVFWCASLFGLAAEKAELKESIQRLEDPVNAHRQMEKQLTALLAVRKTEMQAAEKTLVNAEERLHLHSYQSTDDARKIATEKKIDRAREQFDNAKAVFVRVDEALLEHMEKDPRTFHRKDDALESAVNQRATRS